MQAIGYKETAAALRGEMTMEEAVERIKRGTRRYAKRQISWCSRYSDALRIDWEKKPDYEEGLRLSTDFLRSRGVI
jgi:tRNA dimethylallyltransferase